MIPGKKTPASAKDRTVPTLSAWPDLPPDLIDGLARTLAAAIVKTIERDNAEAAPASSAADSASTDAYPT